MTDAAEAESLHVSPGRLTDLRGRFLLVSYHFPPLPTAGAVRWGRFAELAAERGWILDVIAGHPAEYDRADISALERLPPGTRVYGVPRRLSFLQRAGTMVARAVSVRRASRGRAPGAAHRPTRQVSLTPDEMRGSWWDPAYLRRAYLTLATLRGDHQWARDAFRLGEALSRKEEYQLVISCGPPHMAHVAGKQLACHAGLPFVMDLRDPWSLECRLPTEQAHPLYFTVARRHENQCVEDADLVVTNTDEVREAMEQSHRSGRARFLTVRNGYDELDLPPPPPGRPATFKITYAGSIYLDRDPEPLFRAVHSVVRELALTSNELAVELIGNVNVFADSLTAAIAAQCGIWDFVHLYPRQNRDRLWAMLNESSMLVSLPQDSPWAIPSKIYEYMQFNAWLLILAGAESPTARLLSGSGADIVAPSDVAGIADIIARRYREHASGIAPPRIAHPRFSRANQASRFFDALEHVACSGNRR